MEEKVERMRVDIWPSLKQTVQAEIDVTGLTASEIINIIIAKYFGVFPDSR